MSLVLALTDGKTLGVIADTRAFSTEDGAIKPLAEKLAKISGEDWEAIVAITGEAEINGHKIVEHLRMNSTLLKEGKTASLKEYLERQWVEDVKNYPWNSDKEREDYETSSRISLLIATSRSNVTTVDGDYPTLNVREHQPLKGSIALGDPEPILHLIPQNEIPLTEWPNKIISIFSKASQLRETIAPPLDIALWKDEGLLNISRLELESIEPFFETHLQ